MVHSPTQDPKEQALLYAAQRLMCAPALMGVQLNHTMDLAVLGIALHKQGFSQALPGKLTDLFKNHRSFKITRDGRSRCLITLNASSARRQNLLPGRRHISSAAISPTANSPTSKPRNAKAYSARSSSFESPNAEPPNARSPCVESHKAMVAAVEASTATSSSAKSSEANVTHTAAKNGGIWPLHNIRDFLQAAMVYVAQSLSAAARFVSEGCKSLFHAVGIVHIEDAPSQMNDRNDARMFQDPTDSLLTADCRALLARDEIQSPQQISLPPAAVPSDAMQIDLPRCLYARCLA